MDKPGRTKIAILSLSLVAMSTNTVAVLMGDIGESYPEIDTVAIQYFLNISGITITAAILLSGALSAWLGARRIVLPGLAVYTIAGIAPMWIDDFTWLLVSRAAFGLGLGLVFPLAVSLIADFYTGEERTRTLGLQFAVGSAGMSVMMLTAGVLARFGWRTSFLVFLIGIPVFLYVRRHLPEPPKKAGGSMFANLKTNGRVLFCVAVIGTYNMIYTTVFSNLSLLAKQDGFGDAASIGAAMTAMTGLSIAAAALFGKAHRALGSSLGGMAALVIATAFVLLGRAESMAAVTAGLLTLGLGNALLMPFGNMKVGSLSPAAAAAFSLALNQAACNLGAFASPFVFSRVGAALSGGGARAIYSVCGIVLYAGGALYLVLVAARKRRCPASQRACHE